MHVLVLGSLLTGHLLKLGESGEKVRYSNQHWRIQGDGGAHGDAPNFVKGRERREEHKKFGIRPPELIPEYASANQNYLSS